jgi:spermidine synthase
MWPGMALSIEVEAVLYRKRSEFQLIEIFQTKTSGRMLVLDGIIQLTEADEFAYHEMMTHIPMYAHPHPEYVLVIGGGDGGVLRELARHDTVKSIDYCEIDEAVIQAAKEFLPFTACGFDDPRIHVTIEDGGKFIKDRQSRYDVIIVDSSDPIGPGEALFEKPFYQDLKRALKQNGIIATQGESFFLHKEYVIRLAKITKSLFPVHAYAYILVPTYPGGNIGVCLGSLGQDVKMPSRSVSTTVQNQLKYYSPEIHKAAFTLPYFAENLFAAV